MARIRSARPFRSTSRATAMHRTGARPPGPPGCGGMEALKIHAVGYHRVVELRQRPQRHPAETLAHRHDPVGPAPDPARERTQYRVSPFQVPVVRVVAGHVRAPEGDDHRRLAEVEEGNQGAGGKREIEVNGVVLRGPQQAPDHRQSGTEVAAGVAHAGLVNGGPAATYAVHVEQSLFGGIAVPQQLRLALRPVAGGDDVHGDTARRQRAGERLGGHAGAAAVRWVLVVQQEHAHRSRSPHRRSLHSCHCRRSATAERGKRYANRRWGSSTPVGVWE